MTRVVVTTTDGPSPALETRARALAARLGHAYVPRGRLTLRVLLDRAQATAALILGDDALRYGIPGQAYGFHPNMARQRVATLVAARGDRLSEVAALRPGDRFLDCTCGLGADAIVAAHVVGPPGSVAALEASPILATLVDHGLRHYRHRDPALVAAMRRVRVQRASYRELLPTLEDDSWDVVYLDPMFETPVAATRSLDLVRRLAVRDRPTSADIDHAARVARRAVIIKDRAPGALLDALGVPVASRSHRIWFGALPASTTATV